jgi:hypothetical protein
MEEAYTRCVQFLEANTSSGLPLVIFGGPFQVKEFCTYIAKTTTGSVALPVQSILVTGGGWKTFLNEKISRAELADMVKMRLGIPSSHVIDTYSTAELNCVFMSCRAGRYHIPPLVEAVVLDEEYRGSPGQTGLGVLGILDPFASSYPGFLITGDHIRLRRDRCDCGLDGSSIEGEITRHGSHETKGCGGVMSASLARTSLPEGSQRAWQQG